MKPQEAFALAIRITGLIGLIYLLGTASFLIFAGAPWQFVLRSIIWALISLWFLRGAPQLVRFAYRESE